MVKRIDVVLTLLPLTLFAWESPLPSLGQNAIATGQAAFFNPAAAGSGQGGTTTLSFAQDRSLWTTVTDPYRLGSLHYQGSGHAEGLRVWESEGLTRTRADMALGTPCGGYWVIGAKIAYQSAESSPDAWISDLGAQFRPWSFFQAGYWGENLWSTGAGALVHHGAVGIRPLALYRNGYQDLTLGMEVQTTRDSFRDVSLLAHIPLVWGLQFQSRWDMERRGLALGILLQATAHWTGAWGPTRSRNAVDMQEAGVEFRTRQKTPFLLAQGTVAELDLNHSIVEGETPRGFLAGHEIGFLDLRKRLDVMEANPRLRTVLVKLGKAKCGWGIGAELRGRLLRLRSRGKRVMVYMDQVTPLNYYLASAADGIAMQPSGYFAVTGFSAEVTFYRGLLEKLGVEPQFLRHGKFKSFEEAYTRKQLSEEARFNLSEYLASQWDHYLDAVSLARGLPRDTLRAALEAGDISLAHARRARLIDTLLHQDQALEWAGGKGASLDGNLAEETFRSGWDFPPRIAVVVVEGDMVLGRSSKGILPGSEMVGAQSVAAQLRKARLNSGIRAVLLRVNSPGGSAQAADIIWREIELLKAAGKPVVASIGHVAASGGYYILCGADRVLSEPNSTVGSIGVLWGKFVLKGLYDKLGISQETLKTSPHADATSLTRPWDSLELAVLQNHMDEFYRDFLSKVAKGRKLKVEEADSVGQGRIFTGTQALRNGLVDKIGGMDEAVEETCRLAGLSPCWNVELVAYSPSPSLGFPFPGEWAKSPTGLDRMRRELETYQAWTVPQLWAITPELAGWFPAPL